MSSRRIDVLFDWSNLTTPDDWIEAMARAKAQVPVEYLPHLVVDVLTTSSYGDSFALVEVYYERPETDEEIEAREASYLARRKQDIARLEAQLAQLKS